MTIEQAATILMQMYKTAQHGERVVQIHLFGIRYADDLQGFTVEGNPRTGWFADVLRR